MQKTCSCRFLYGPETSEPALQRLQKALEGHQEHRTEICFYRKDGKEPDLACLTSVQILGFTQQSLLGTEKLRGLSFHGHKLLVGLRSFLDLSLSICKVKEPDDSSPGCRLTLNLHQSL